MDVFRISQVSQLSACGLQISGTQGTAAWVETTSPQGAFPWLSPPPKPGKSALGTRLGWRMSLRIGLWDINLQNICPLEKGTNCCFVFSFFALCAKYLFHRLTRPVKHINPRNKHKAFYSGNYRNNTAGSKTLQMAGLVEELSGLSSC